MFALKDFLTLIEILVVVDVLIFYYKYFTRPNPLPGPTPLPYIGNVLTILYTLFKEGIYSFDLGEYARLQTLKYGEITEFYMGNIRFVNLSRAEYLENVFSNNTNTKYFWKPTVNGLSELEVKYGLFFNNDYKSWKRLRKFVAQSLMSPRFLRGITGTIQNLFEEYEYKFTSQDETIFNLTDWIRCFTTDITMSTSTGQKSYCLASTNLKESEWTEEMKESRRVMQIIETYFKSLTFLAALLRFIRHYLPFFSYYQNLYMNNITSFQIKVLEKVKNRREQIRQMSEDEKNNVGSDLLDIFLTSVETNESYEPLNDFEIRDNIIDITLAGTDTTSNLFAVTFWHINKYPEVKTRVLEEIRSVFGEDISKCKITYEDLDKLKYLDAVIKESARMKPILPASSRVLTTTDTIAGYKLDSNTPICMSNLYILNHKDYWKEPEKFNPDRFLNDKIIKNSFTPFGGGIRMCPGRLMAVTLVKTITILFLGKYNCELVDKVSPLQHTYISVNVYSDIILKLSPKKTDVNLDIMTDDV